MRFLLSTAVALVAAALPIVACGSNSTTHSTTSGVAGPKSTVAGTTSSAAGTTPSAGTTAPANPADPICPLTVDTVQAAIGTVFRGPVKLDNIPGALDCSYQVDDNRWLHIRVSPYAADRKATIIVNTTKTEYGGTSARQVFTSADHGVPSSRASHRGFEQYPNIGAGLVTNGVGGFVLAATRDVWYSGDFGIFTSRDYNVVAMNVAKALAAL